MRAAFQELLRETLLRMRERRGQPANVAVDPRGVVPINRVQPMGNDPMEAQRLMERRLGSMPPSSFSGAGSAFVPAQRPLVAPRSYPQGMANVMAGATLNQADIKTDRPMGLLGTAY